MAKPLMDDSLWEIIRPLIPPKERRQKYSGRKRVCDRAALTGILFVLKTGIGWVCHRTLKNSFSRIKSDLIGLAGHQLGNIFPSSPFWLPPSAPRSSTLAEIFVALKRT